MFGIVEQPCGRRDEWMAHLCGLCLTLRDRHGQVSRVTTNRDAVVLSALYEAQAGDVRRRRAAPCPLRGFRAAGVVDASSPGARFAAAVTLLLAAVAIDDKAADGQLGSAVVAVPAASLAAGWRRKALSDAAGVGFDGGVVLDIVGQQAELEATPGLRFLDYSKPTERSVGAVFRHTAVLASRPGNTEGLDRAGQMFGRIAYLLDAWEDREADRRHGRFNALDAASGGEDPRPLFRSAHGELGRRLDSVDLPRPALVRALLVDGLHRTGMHVLSAGGDPGPDRGSAPPRWVSGLLAGCAAAIGSCGVCTVCVRSLEDACTCRDCGCNDCECTACDCSGCDCSGCDCSGCDCSGCEC